jgi:hypothetical protein
MDWSSLVRVMLTMCSAVRGKGKEGTAVVSDDLLRPADAKGSRKL